MFAGDAVAPYVRVLAGGREIPVATSDGVMHCDPGAAPATLIVAAAGFVPQRLEWDGVRADGAASLRMEPGLAFGVTIVDAAGDPVPWARLRVVPDADRVPEWFAIVAKTQGWWGVSTGESGESALRMTGLPAGAYRLLVTVPGMPEEALPRRVQAGAGDVKLVLPSHLSPRLRAIDVVLLGLDGEPVEQPAAELRIGAGPTVIATGEFGSVTLVATGTGPVSVVASTSIAGCLPTPLRLVACAHDIDENTRIVTLRLRPPPGTRELTIAPPPDGAEGAFVRVIDRFRGTNSGTLWLGPKGLTVPTFDDAVLAVVLASMARCEPSGIGAALVGVTAGETIALPPPAPQTWQIRGHVRRPDGTPVAWANVRARSIFDTPDAGLTLRVTTDVEGRFELPSIHGPVAITARAPGLSNVERAEIVRRGSTEIAIVVTEERLP